MFNLEAIWNDREFNNPPQFYNWFVEHCMESVKETMLKPLRIAARLGNPPLPFYTNEVESQNNVIKQQLSYRAQELPKFVESMRKMIENQRKDIERAVVSMGEYRLSKDFQHLSVDSRKFFQMTEQQEEKALSRLFNAPFEDLDETKKLDSEDSSSVEEENSISNTDPLTKIACLPQFVASKIWNDSEEIASSANSMCESPGCTDGSAWLVKSSNPSRQRPYFVECKKGHITCEQSCMLFNSSGVCVHTCLLYTSPSPRDATLSRMPSSA